MLHPVSTNPYKIRGFTLIELSIVIVIVGVVIAGITAGQSLVRQARIQSVLTDINKYKTGYDAFRLQYNSRPGDMKNASSYWGIAVNGNGNGLIGINEILDPEALGIFQHLALAGFIEGSYTGLYGSGIVIGRNAPKSTYKKTATYYSYSGSLWNNYPLGNSLVLSGQALLGYDDYQVNVVDAYNIDKKIDDGNPYIGNVIAYHNADGVCVDTKLLLISSAARKTQSYRTSAPTELCTMHFAFSDYKFR